MSKLGLDIGTKTIVLAYPVKDKVNFLSEINGYYVYERATPFVVNMLKDDTKVRSDGTKRPAKWFELNGRIFVLGRDAEELAYAHNDTMKRPMAKGGITADEDSMTVLSALVHNLLELAENEIGTFEKPVKLVYCTTAPALNESNNIEYHEQVVNLVLGGYGGGGKLVTNKIKESHAIVLNEAADGSGIGISWGAGTVTVSYVKSGIEIYSFCWVGAGDWIDEQVAIRHGYNPLASKARGKVARETPTTIAKRKHTVDLTPGLATTDRVEFDIRVHYQVLINQVIDGIVAGFDEHAAQAKIDDAVPVFMAGGTSSPVGFEQQVAAEFVKRELGFTLGAVTKSTQPLYAVAEGLLKAAEYF